MIFQVEKIGACNPIFEASTHTSHKVFDLRVKLYLKEIYSQNNPELSNKKYEKEFKYRCPFKNCNKKFNKNILLLHLRRHVLI
jgi:hypothetical protein